MLVKRRSLTFPNGAEFRTPILLPSFSSKGFPSIQKIFTAAEEYISDEILISAYDVKYGLLKPPFDFASLVFLDSGGYEASKDADMSEIYGGDHVYKEWTPELYQDVLKGWECVSPTVFVTFDSPNTRTQFAQQLTRAMEFEIPSEGLKNFLIKPESNRSTRVRIENVIPSVKHLEDFGVIGVTEKEIGKSLLDRMLNIAKLRQALDRKSIDTPIHIFGSLDTLSTYLFFLAGADVFDGLTWLRYAFLDGDTIYRHSYGALSLPITTNSDIVEGRAWSHNYQYLVQMQLNMVKFLNDYDYSHFGKHHETIKAAHQTMLAELKE